MARLLFRIRGFLEQQAVILCLAVAVICFGVGLWPFSFFLPNSIGIPETGDGLLFQPFSVAYSDGEVRLLGDAAAGEGFTLELDLEPLREPVWEIGSLLTVFLPDLARRLEVAQFGTALLLRTPLTDGRGRQWYKEQKIEGLMIPHRRVVLVITSSPAGISTFLNGRPHQSVSGFRLDEVPIQGILLLGIDPNGHRNWEGKLYGLAAFARRVEPSEAALHSRLWESGQALLLAEEPGLRALYLLRDRAGTRLRDEAAGGKPLLLPEYYGLPYYRLLVSPAQEWRPSVAHLKDLGINILGFLPAGFLAFFLFRRRFSGAMIRAAAGSVAFGTLLSLSIELTQVLTPLRSSSQKDLYSNIFGACLGAAVAAALVMLERWAISGRRA